MSDANVMIRALESERDGYLKYDRHDRAAECDKQIKLWKKKADTEQKVAIELAAAGGSSLSQPDHIRKIVATIGSLRDERAGLVKEGKKDRVGQVDDQIEYWTAQLSKDGVVLEELEAVEAEEVEAEEIEGAVVTGDVENTSQDRTGVETATVKPATKAAAAKKRAASKSAAAKK